MVVGIINTTIFAQAETLTAWKMWEKADNQRIN